MVLRLIHPSAWFRLEGSREQHHDPVKFRQFASDRPRIVYQRMSVQAIQAQSCTREILNATQGSGSNTGNRTGTGHRRVSRVCGRHRHPPIPSPGTPEIPAPFKPYFPVLPDPQPSPFGSSRFRCEPENGEGNFCAGGGETMRIKEILVTLILYVLVSGGGAVFGPFIGNADCQSFRYELGAGGYCLPLWQ